jgi:hypothetical protein
MKTDVAGGLLIFILGGVTVILSSRLPIGTLRQAGEGLLPLALGIILMILALLYLLQVILGREKEAVASESKPLTLAEIKRVVPFLLTIALATALLPRLGYLLSAFLLMLGLLKLLGMKSWPTAGAYAATAAGLAHLLFSYWLKVPLPRGWLGF